ncbi:MAG: twin-arginine translocase TatA/TatE family subunit [Ignavibacteriales bacterium]|nr:twin-arginine translocase TatA/TatE family subunit [Ignavibacteriales bacterium]MCB9210571.1 twin-arginine translocase TatA/TatE family subunit [Ignavibacteriales bacterium]MCB9219946.1 twin-arginine translocase TatA/TatE family subunit [Ignavibacteriales bacterium]
MFGSLGATEIILIIVVIVLLFGAKKIPELAQGVGKGMREFKKAVKEVEEDITDIKDEVKTDKKK